MDMNNITSTSASMLRKSNINATNGTIVQSCLSFLHRSLSIKRWIEKVLGEKLNEDSDDSKGLLLFGELMNGIILCKLMSVLKSNSIPKIHTGDTILGFKIRENLCFYIQALQDIGISRHFQFAVPDLLEKKNLLKVLESLEVLADDCNEFEKPIELTDEQQLLIHFTDKQLSDTEQMLKQLNVTQVKRQPLKKLMPNEPKRFTTSLTSSVGSVPSPGGSGSKLNFNGTGSGMGNSLSQSTGSKLFQSRIVSTPANVKPRAPLSVAQILDKARPMEKRWIRIQSLIRGHLARKSYQKKVRNAAYRHNIVKELLATEIVYIDSLQHVVSHYFNPMREDSSKLNIKLDHFGLLISNLEVIINYNKNLLDNIKPKVENWSHSQTIGDIFEQFTLYLKVYTQYVKEYSVFFEAINNLRKTNAKFETFIVEKEYNDNYKSIGTYLILPIQRIPRYTMLLTELLKNTWSDHLDFNNLTLSLKKMQEVALYVNEKKREAENIAKVTEIQNNFIGKFENLLCGSARFVHEGNLSVIGPDGKESQRVVFLFNEVLIVTKSITSGFMKKKVSYKVKETIRMNLVQIRLKQQTSSNGSSSGSGSNSSINLNSSGSGNGGSNPVKISSTPKSSSASSLLNSNSSSNLSNLSLSSSTPNTPPPSSTISRPTSKPVPPPRSQATFNVAIPTSLSSQSPSSSSPVTQSPTLNSTSKPTIGVKPPLSSSQSSSASPQSTSPLTSSSESAPKPRSSTTIIGNGSGSIVNIHNQIRQPTPISTVVSSNSQERLIVEEKMKKQNLTIELIDTFGTCILKLLCSTPKEKDQWTNELKKVYEDLDNKKIINDDAMKRSQERAGLAKAALSQQYATLRVKGRLCDVNTLKTSINQEEADSNNGNNVNTNNGGGTTSSSTDSTSTAIPGERDFNALRRQTLSVRRSTQNPNNVNCGNSTTTSTTTSTTDNTSDHSDSDDKKHGTIGGSSNAKNSSKTGTGWFSSLRKKKNHPSIQDTFGLDTSPITQTTNNNNNNTAAADNNNTVILKQDN